MLFVLEKLIKTFRPKKIIKPNFLTRFIMDYLKNLTQGKIDERVLNGLSSFLIYISEQQRCVIGKFRMYFDYDYD